MKLSENIKPISGRLTLQAFDSKGRELWTKQDNNHIVLTGYNAVARAIAGQVNARVNRVSVGTNGTPPTDNDTALTGKVDFTPTVSYPTPTTLQFDFLIGNFDANGTVIREFGLITADDKLFSRITEIDGVPINIDKSSNFALRGIWTINII